MKTIKYYILAFRRGHNTPSLYHKEEVSSIQSCAERVADLNNFWAGKINADGDEYIWFYENPGEIESDILNITLRDPQNWINIVLGYVPAWRV